MSCGNGTLHNHYYTHVNDLYNNLFILGNIRRYSNHGHYEENDAIRDHLLDGVFRCDFGMLRTGDSLSSFNGPIITVRSTIGVIRSTLQKFCAWSLILHFLIDATKLFMLPIFPELQPQQQRRHNYHRQRKVLVHRYQHSGFRII